MTDPERWSKGSTHSLAGLLLRAGAEEKPSAAVLKRTSAALAAVGGASAKSAAAATIGTSAPSGASIGIGAVAKWLAIGALGGAVAASSVQALITEQGTKHAPAAPKPGAPPPAPSPTLPAMKAARPLPELAASNSPKSVERASTVEAPRAPSAVPSLPAVAKAIAPERTEGAFLAAEVRFVDQGRSALQHTAFSEALEQLDPYERLFPRQQLLTEVLFLRMEALSRLGKVEPARTLAARVLALGVAGRQAAQAREVLAH